MEGNREIGRITRHLDSLQEQPQRRWNVTQLHSSYHNGLIVIQAMSDNKYEALENGKLFSIWNWKGKTFSFIHGFHFGRFYFTFIILYLFLGKFLYFLGRQEIGMFCQWFLIKIVFPLFEKFSRNFEDDLNIELHGSEGCCESGCSRLHWNWLQIEFWEFHVVLIRMYDIVLV